MDDEALEDMGGIVPSEEKIWDYVKVRNLYISKLDAGKYVSEPTIFVGIEGEVSWEIEHGLQMSWANGNKLVKVGEYDDHQTNSRASADPKRDQYVFD